LNLFLDSSALAKRYIADETSEELDELLGAAHGMSVSVLCLPEIVSALCRRRRERFLTKAQYEEATRALEVDLADAVVLQITDEVVLETVRLLESHPLRSNDAIHIASARIWRVELFISADSRQCDAAKASGLEVVQL